MIRSKNILLGSGAAFIHAEREFPRLPKDRDAIYHKDAIPLFMESPVVKTFIMTRPSKYKAKSNFGMFWEVELAEVEDNSSTELWKLYDTLRVVDEYCRIPCLDLLREIKMCHRFKYSPHFEKTRGDILWFRQHTKGIVKDEWKPFLAKRLAESNRKTPRLKGHLRRNSSRTRMEMFLNWFMIPSTRLWHSMTNLHIRTSLMGRLNVV